MNITFAGLFVAPHTVCFNPCIAQNVRVIGFDFHPSPYELLHALFPLLCSSCHFATPSHRQEGVKASYTCSEEAKNRANSSLPVFDIITPPTWHCSTPVTLPQELTPGSTRQQHTQKTTCLTANCLRGALQSLAIYVSAGDTVGLLNRLFSYSKRYNKAAHKNALAFPAAAWRSYLFSVWAGEWKPVLTRGQKVTVEASF